MTNLDILIKTDFSNLNNHSQDTIKKHIHFHKEIMKKDSMSETEAYQNWKEYLFEPIIQELIDFKLIKRKDRTPKRTEDIFTHYKEISLRMFHNYSDIKYIIKNDIDVISFFCSDYYSDVYGKNKLYKKKIKKIIKSMYL